MDPGSGSGMLKLVDAVPVDPSAAIVVDAIANFHRPGEAGRTGDDRVLGDQRCRRPISRNGNYKDSIT